MILCFTGTGNSLAVARQLATPGEAVVMLNDAEACKTLAPAPGEAIKWVYPTYSWGIPPVVRRWINTIPIPPHHLHYLVTTCGDDIGLHHRQWRRAIRRRGWTARGAWSVQMPNNYTLMKGFDVDAPDVAAAKLRAMPSRVAAIAKAIAETQAEFPIPIDIAGDTAASSKGTAAFIEDVVTGRWPWVKTRIIYPWFIRRAMSPRPFHATDACTSCGLCARSCPMSHIVMADGHPRWDTPVSFTTSKDNATSPDVPGPCALCLRCYHRCPAHAVAYGHATLHKGQYPGPGTSVKE